MRRIWPAERWLKLEVAWTAAFSSFAEEMFRLFDQRERSKSWVVSY
jgi:hypothetical protein